MAEVKWARAWQNLRVRTSRSAEDASNLAAVLDELGVRELGLADLLRVDRAARWLHGQLQACGRRVQQIF